MGVRIRAFRHLPGTGTAARPRREGRRTASPRSRPPRSRSHTSHAQLALTRAVRLGPGDDAPDPRRRWWGRQCRHPAREGARASVASSPRPVGQTRRSQDRDLGYDDVIGLSKESLSEGVMRLTDGKGADAALTRSVARSRARRSASVAPGGRLIRRCGYPAGDGTWRSTSLTADLERARRRWVAERRRVQHLLPAAGGLCRRMGDGRCRCSRRGRSSLPSTGPTRSRRPPKRRGRLIEDRPFGKVRR